MCLRDFGHWAALSDSFIFSSDEESMKDDTSLEVFNAAKETLLQGLSEENQGLQ